MVACIRRDALQVVLLVGCTAFMAQGAASPGDSVSWGSISSALSVSGGDSLSKSSGGGGTARSTDATSSTIVGFKCIVAQVFPGLLGLTEKDKSGDPSHGFLVNQFEEVFISEGAELISIQQTYATDDEFEVRVSKDNKVEYLINDVVRYTSTNTPPSEMQVLITIQGGGSGIILEDIVWVGKSSYCNQVTCTTNIACKVAGECVEGVCGDPTNDDDGTTCNDGNSSTTDDQCSKGVCVGSDPCADVTCPASDTCHEDGQCSNGNCFTGASKPIGTECDDGDATTENDKCVQQGNLVVCEGTPITTTTTTETTSTTQDLCAGVTCPEPDDCHQDGACVNGQCVPGPAKDDNTRCDDSNDETIDDVCLNGVCVGTDPCEGVICDNPSVCQKNGKCSGGQCTYEDKEDGEECDDGLERTDPDRCFANVCVGADFCLGKTCFALSQCHEPGDCFRGVCSNPTKANGTSCDDGDANTAIDYCNENGICIGVDLCEGVTCTPASQCHFAATCNANDGKCPSEAGELKPVGTACDDGNAETLNDTCTSSGSCAGVPLCDTINCEEELPADDCREPSTCEVQDGKPVCLGGSKQSDFSECDDGNDDTVDDLCFDGLCSGIDKCDLDNIQCSPLDDCHVAGVCKGGVCSNPIKDDGTTCDDGNLLTRNDTCAAGVCKGTPYCEGVTCSGIALSNCHLPNTCNPLNGECYDPLKLDNTVCDDGNETTSNDVCTQGVCAGVDLCVGVTCPTITNPCQTVQPCFQGQCLIKDKPNKTTCDDGNENTINDNCQAGVCVGLDTCANVTCTPASQCHEEVECRLGVCVSVTGEEFVENKACDDGDSQTVQDICIEGVCIGTNLCEDVVCGGATQCRAAQTCNHADGECLIGEPLPNGTSCDNGDTDFVDSCVNGECVSVPLCEARPENTTCDDHDPLTDFDKCTLNGTCAGVDLCIEPVVVDCPEPTQCQEPVDRLCNNGNCTEFELKTPGTLCDDGDEDTIFDACQFNGECVGINLCENVTCQQGQCYPSSNECNHLNGECGAPRTGAQCDDGNDDTRDDRCTLAGTCEGIISCGGVDCEAPSQCKLPLGCNGTACTFKNEEEGTPCDDGDNTTDVDTCENGVCVGRVLCDEITCEVPVCRESVSCFAGSCFPGDAQADGTNCDNDEGFCIDGFCTSKCDFNNVECKALDQCHEVGVCSKGECSHPLSVDGKICDDGNSTTDNDQCISGVCVGEDLCETNNVVCSLTVEQQECIESSLCRNGVCQITQKPNGTKCDDGDDVTSNDECFNGVCGGVDLCIGVTCPSETDCAEASVCRLGICLPPVLKQEGLPCNDGSFGTYADSCSSGTCSANVECTSPAEGGACVAWETKIGVKELSNYGLEKTDSSDSFDHGAISLLSISANSTVWGVQFKKSTLENQPLVFVGLGAGDGVLRYQDISYGILLVSAGSVGVYERGEATSFFDGVTEGGDTLAIRINKDSTDNLVVEYLRNGAVQYTSDVAPSDQFPLYVEVLIFGQGGVVTDFEYIRRSDILCEDVTCSPTTDECREDPVCSYGICQQPEISADNTTCDDGKSTTDRDTCMGGLCAGVDLCDVLNVQCPQPNPVAELHDQCKTFTGCRNGVCQAFGFKPSGTACDDQNEETADDECQDDGTCQGTNLCDAVKDTCNRETSCLEAEVCSKGLCLAAVKKDDGLSCDDGSDLTIRDVCTDGVCAGVDLCLDANGTRAQCEPKSCYVTPNCLHGQCDYQPSPVGTVCDDGNPFTFGDVCDGQGNCTGVDECLLPNLSRKNCPKRECYKDTICLQGNCTYEPEARGESCDDGLAQTTGDICDGEGNCVGVDLCEARNVVCDPIPCYGSTVCFQGACLPLNQLDDGTSCDDGNFLTDFDKCIDGECIGEDLCVTANVQCGTGDQCNDPEVCQRGECIKNPKANGTDCDDGDDRTSNDQCKDGVCVGKDLCDDVSFPTLTDEQKKCLGQTCFQGKVSLVQLTGPCDDEDDSTDDDQCVNGACVGTDRCLEPERIVCNPVNQCENPVSCYRGECPVPQFKPTGTSCDDGNPRTVNDICNEGICAGEDKCANVLCTAATSCRAAAQCSITNGTCMTGTPINEGQACNDGDDETRGDTCTQGECVGFPLTCPATSSGAVRFNNGCGGFGIDGLNWQFLIDPTSSSAEAMKCHCIASGTGAAFGEPFGKIRSSEECAQAICDGRGFVFSQCRWEKNVVSQGTWNRGVLTVSYQYQDNICTDGQTTFAPDITTIGSGTTTTEAAAVTTTSASCAPRSVGQAHLVENFVTSNTEFFNQAFQLTIRKGDTVTWTWGGPDGAPPMNVKSGSGPTDPNLGKEFDSGSPTPVTSDDTELKTFTHRFTTAGTFRFHAGLFINLGGVIIVEDAVTVLASTPQTLVEEISWTANDPVSLAQSQKTITVGTTVVWSWNTTSNLYVRSGVSSTNSDAGFYFNSGSASRAGTLNVKFNYPGVYEYHGPGSAMRSYVRVEDPICPTPIGVLPASTTTDTKAYRGGGIVGHSSDTSARAVFVFAVAQPGQATTFYFDYAFSIVKMPSGQGPVVNVQCFWNDNGQQRFLDNVPVSEVQKLNDNGYLERSVLLPKPAEELQAIIAGLARCELVFGNTTQTSMSSTVRIDRGTRTSLMKSDVYTNGRGLAVFDWVGVDRFAVTYHAVVSHLSGEALAVNFIGNGLTLALEYSQTTAYGTYYTGTLTIGSGAESFLNAGVRLAVPSTKVRVSEISGVLGLETASELSGANTATTTQAPTTLGATTTPPVDVSTETTTRTSTTSTTSGNPHFDMLQASDLEAKLIGPDALPAVDISAESPTIETKFSVVASATQVSGTSGYLFAKTQNSGFVRYYGLWIAQDKIQFWYYTSDNTRSFVEWPFLSPGTSNEYRLLLTVDGTVASLSISTESYTTAKTFRQLQGSVSDCESTDAAGCRMIVGARSSSTGDRLAVDYEGRLLVLKLYNGIILDSHPDGPVGTSDQSTLVGISLLNSSITESALSSDPVSLGTDEAVRLDGNAALKLTEHPARPLSSGWCVSMAARQEAGTFGYIFAKTNAAGSRRYYSLYSNAISKTLYFFYRDSEMSSGSSRRVTISNVNLGDGKTHRITLCITGRVLESLIDDQNSISLLSGTASSDANYQLDDCGAPSSDCEFHIGRRSSSTGTGFPFKGDIYQVNMYPQRAFPNGRFIEHLGRPYSFNLLESNGGSNLKLPIESGLASTVSPLRKVEEEFSISMQFTASIGSTMYLFCKSGTAGSLRDRRYCLYISSIGHLYLYYRPAGISSTASSPRLGPFTDSSNSLITVQSDKKHVLVVTFTGNDVRLLLDDKEGKELLANGALADCTPGNDCVMYVGQRSNGAGSTRFVFNGTIHTSTLFYQ